MKLQQKILRVAGCLVALFGMFLATASPAAAIGSSTVNLRSDGVWRTLSWSVNDASIKSACPGPTTQGLNVTAQLKANSSGFWIQNIYLTNRAGTTLATDLSWNNRVMYASPTGAWSAGQKRLVVRPTFPGVITHSEYQSWAGSAGRHNVILSNGCGVGFNPIFWFNFKRA